MSLPAELKYNSNPSTCLSVYSGSSTTIGIIRSTPSTLSFIFLVPIRLVSNKTTSNLYFLLIPSSSSISCVELDILEFRSSNNVNVTVLVPVKFWQYTQYTTLRMLYNFIL